MPDTTIQRDPRTYFALERTFLAWIRTGLALMGVGFAVARFGLFLRELASTPGHAPVRSTGLSLWSGVALVILGVAVTGFSIADHVRTVRQLRSETWKPGQVSVTAIVLAAALTLAGLGMSAYLMVLR